MAKLKRSGRFFVYILRCRDGTFYTGYTPDLARRLELHNAGKGARYTRSRRPVDPGLEPGVPLFQARLPGRAEDQETETQAKRRLIGSNQSRSRVIRRNRP